MLQKTTLLFRDALQSPPGFAAPAETMDWIEPEKFGGASVPNRQTIGLALQCIASTFAGIAFGEENCRAACEAVEIGGDGRLRTVLIGAKTGEVFASAVSSSIGDNEDEGESQPDVVRDAEEKNGLWNATLEIWSIAPLCHAATLHCRKDYTE